MRWRYSTLDRNSCKRGHWGWSTTSAGVPCSIILPPSINSTREATSRAKPISWVTTTIVIPSWASYFITLKDSYKERAELDVKVELALEKIAELEGIEVTDEEVEAELAAMAEKYSVDLDTVKKAVLPETVKKELKARKADEVVISNAVAEGAAKKKTTRKPAAKKTTKKKADAEEAAATEESAE